MSVICLYYTVYVYVYVICLYYIVYVYVSVCASF